MRSSQFRDTLEAFVGWFDGLDIDSGLEKRLHLAIVLSHDSLDHGAVR